MAVLTEQYVRVVTWCSGDPNFLVLVISPVSGVPMDEEEDERVDNLIKRLLGF